MAKKTEFKTYLNVVPDTTRSTQPPPQAQGQVAQAQQVQATQQPTQQPQSQNSYYRTTSQQGIQTPQVQQPSFSTGIVNQINATNQQRVNVSNPGLSESTMKEIRRKAELGIPLDSPDATKQGVYDQFQLRSAQLIAQAARNGQRLHEPNAWKQSVYDEVMNSLNPNDSAYYQSDQIMNRQYEESQKRMSAMEQFLAQTRDGYMKSQEALLGKARDEQVAQLQKALEDAVADGKISVREAEAAFVEQKGMIEQEGYNDAERTKLAATNRGISNSAQMMGMMASDNSRRTSMLNQNMTERDRRIADIKDRVNAIKNKSAIDITNANANYNYGIAGAQGQADMQFGTQMFDMYNQDHMLTRQQQFQLDQQGMGQNFQRTVAQIQQQYTLEQFAVQQGYNIDNMNLTQRYQLQQMYQGHVYNMAMQNNAQGWQGGQNALDRNHQYGMQNNAQNWQGGQNALDRNHQGNMQDNAQNWQGGQNALDRSHQAVMQERQQQWQAGENSQDRTLARENLQKQLDAQAQAANSVIDEYELALQREMNKYTPGTPEYTLAEAQKEQAVAEMREEVRVKTGTEIAAKQLIDGGPTSHPGDKPKPPAKNWFQNIQSSVAKKFPTLAGISGMNSKKLEDARLKAYNEELKAWEQAMASYKNYMEFLGVKP